MICNILCRNPSNLNELKQRATCEVTRKQNLSRLQMIQPSWCLIGMKKYIKSVLTGELNRIRTSFIGVLASAPSVCTTSNIFTTRSRTNCYIHF